MLRQRNVGGPDEGGEQGIFIGDHEVDPRLGKPKAKGGADVAACWKLFSLVLIVVTGISLCFSTYQMSLVAECVQQVQVTNSSLQHKHGEWEANRHSVSECRAEMKTMESHLNSEQGEKVELETEVARLKRAVLEGGVTPAPDRVKGGGDGGDTPATPSPGKGVTLNHKEEEKRRKEEEENRKVQEEESKRQEEEQERVHLQQREHQARVEQDRRHREEDQRKQEEERKQEEQRKQQEEVQRQQEEILRKQEEIQRQQEELQKQQELQRKQDELKRQQEELHRQQEEQQRQQEEHRRQQEEQQRQKEEEQRRQEQ